MEEKKVSEIAWGVKVKVDGYKGVYRRAIPMLERKENSKGSKEADYMYYIAYRRGGKYGQRFDEPVGKASEGMTASKASNIRALRIQGKDLSNVEKRQIESKKHEEKKKQKKLNDLWEAYYHEIEQLTCAKADKNRYEKHIRPVLGDKSAVDITSADIDKLKQILQSKHIDSKIIRVKKINQTEGNKLTPQSVKHILGLVRRILKYAQSKEMINSVSNINFDMPKVDNFRFETLDTDQVKKYWQVLDSHPDKQSAAFLKIALLTGMRKGAILALKWEDIDYNAKVIWLNGESAKNGKTENIPLNDSVKSVLECIKPKENANGYIFPGKDGQKRKDFRRFARKIRDMVGIDKSFRPVHGLRHTYASLMAKSGKVPMYYLQRLMTHSTSEMTQRYAHLFPETLKEKADVAGEIFDIG